VKKLEQKEQHKSKKNIVEDPQIKEYLRDVKIWDAYKEVKQDPNRMRTLLQDPVLSNMLETAATKIMQFQKESGVGK
jgi:hypothetical protein